MLAFLGVLLACLTLVATAVAGDPKEDPADPPGREQPAPETPNPDPPPPPPPKVPGGPVVPPPGPGQPVEPGAVEPPPPPEEDLFADLLAGKTDGEWRGVLNRIRKEKDATWIGRELGQLFRDRARFADRADLVAFAAAYLADNHNDGKVLLAGDILRRAYGDDAFLEALRRHITAGEGGWARLLDAARAMLASEDPESRAVGAWFLCREDGEQRERVRRDLLQQARADLPWLEQGGEAARGLARAYLDAFATLLQYRFPTVEEAVATLEKLDDLDLAALIRELSRLKDAPTSPLAKKTLEYGKRLVDAAVAAGKVEDLEEFLDPARTPMAAVRRYAMLKAPSLAPSNNAAWARILERIFRREDDAEVLGGALNLLSQVRFAEQPDHALALSSAIARRLLAHGAVGGAARDRTEDRVRMAQAIASLRARTEEFRTLLDHSAELETPVLAELVRALGRIDGASTMEILGYFRQGDDGSDRGREIRIAAVDALGRPGLGAAGQDGDRAGAALREMLGGEGDLGIGRVDDPRVRLNALRSLGNHPGEATADLLRRLALGSDEAEAKVAIVVLRKIAVSGANAVGALAEIVIDETAATPRRIEALQALAGMKGAAQEDAVVRARGTARRVLESKADVEVRKEAARTAAALADPTALDAVAGFWLEAPADEDRRIAFRDLIDAVASTGEGQDVAIARTLDGLRGKAPKAGLEALTRSLLERHPRNPFRRVMCLILLDRAQEEGTPPDAARAALEEADLLLQAILGPEPQDDEYGALGLRVRVKALLGDLAKDAAAKKTHWLEAVRLAARSTDPEVATEGRAVAEHFDDPKLSKALTPDERRRLGEDRAALEKVLVGRTPPDR